MKQFLLHASILALISLNAHAEKFHDLRHIDNQVQQYLYSFPELKKDNNTKIKIHSIDRRLKLSSCDKLSFNLASGSRLIGKTSIRVVCKEPKEWSFYITATISRYTNIYVSNGSFSRGHIFREDDLYKSRKDIARLPFGYITNRKDIIGKELKRHIQAGRIVSPSQLRNPVVIKRGEIISLQRKTSDFMISMKGTAMMNGAIGERIRVRNSSSKRIIEGKIVQPGIVHIGN